MKKLRTFLLTLFLLFITCVTYAQATHSVFSDSEKIFLFNANITVLPNGEITVTEDITVNALNKQINHGIYRDIPLSSTEKMSPVSLQMDGQDHPFSTKRKSDGLRVYFGSNSNNVSKGIHHYTFVYTFQGAIDFHRKFDEIYWNVTGNDWNFPIDKARAQISFPSNVKVQQDGISTYTGAKGSKENHARQLAPLTFETTRPLQPHEGFTVAVPFDKNAIEPPSLLQRIPLSALTAILLLGVFLVYCFITWKTVGKDPVYLAIPQYEPPQGISPAFMQYLSDNQFSSKTLACVLVSLAMKKVIEIKSPLSSGNVNLMLTENERPPLSWEEDQVLQQLFDGTRAPFTLDKSACSKLSALSSSIEEHFKKEAPQYILSNTKYTKWAIILVALLGIFPFLLVRTEIFFLNIGFVVFNSIIALFFLLFTTFSTKFLVKFILGLLLMVFFGSRIWTGMAQEYSTSIIPIVCYIIALWVVTFYYDLIANITPLGKELFAHVDGFKKYMTTAEPARVAASNPVEAESVFCNYLPFAFALNMQNKWMKKFEYILSQATLEQCMECAGGVAFISWGLSQAISSAQSTSSGEGGSFGGGSYGGGSSGGGHGGGGGGGW